ncbi:hypothetical protein C5E45_23740 [Nocardia nova]|uniref:Uncharacterized protein n=1 Tax=Nocardia nova TaxID=37330 RepID=A0A2S6AKS7_9NOCA|nr:hypothetical protein [Nocardia nova]PPJ35824.1 hypothetical protein C5E45_23740 [Nocardia nova]
MILTDTHPPITVLLDPHDTAATTHQLLAAHDPAAGVVVVHPTPGVSAVRGLGADVVAALGRSIGRLAPKRISGPDAIWNAVAAWITADAITHLIVLRAHRLSDRQRAQLLHLRWTTGVHLTLVWHAALARPGPELDLVGIPHRITDDVSALLTGPAVRRPQPLSLVDGPDLPAVPRNEFEQFRAEAFRSLDPTEFRAVDAVYATTMRQVCAQLTSHALAGSCWAHPIMTVWRERARRGDDSPHTGRLIATATGPAATTTASPRGTNSLGGRTCAGCARCSAS